ncbi:transglutaminase-like domain-containing protein [Umezawaea sp.]|uniref:transglutaminase-like domain-containing protein n=1 Tax=Umezawaea sp. TaxID=1955258 RepID=UPI002ED4CA61
MVKIDYVAPGLFTSLGEAAGSVVADDPLEICEPVHGLFLHPDAQPGRDLPAERQVEKDVRPAAELARLLLALDPMPLTSPRAPDKRLVGTCRHFAVMSCALLRDRGIAARVRCGFGMYFEAGLGLDHWVTEFFDGGRWVRVDTEVFGQERPVDPRDLRPGEFLTGGEAWSAYRRGEVDGSKFGVPGTENWGPSEIRGNAVRDLAALNNVEVLPWDEWGRMEEAYQGRTGEDYDELLDELAVVCAGDDLDAVAALYLHPDLRVPDELIAEPDRDRAR